MKEKLLQILADMHPEYDYATSLDFIQDGLLDSFDVVSLIGMLNEEFSIEISGSDVSPENFGNIEALENLVKKYTTNIIAKTKCAKSKKPNVQNLLFSRGLAQQKQRTQKCSLLPLFNALSNAF